MCPHEFSHLTTARFVRFVGIFLTLKTIYDLDLLKTINFSTMKINVSRRAISMVFVDVSRDFFIEMNQTKIFSRRRTRSMLKITIDYINFEIIGVEKHT